MRATDGFCVPLSDIEDRTRRVQAGLAGMGSTWRLWCKMSISIT